MRRMNWLRTVSALGLALLYAAPGLAAPAGLLTILEGEALVLRETDRFAAAEGQRLHSADILSTGANTRLLRVELDDGRLVDLGPSTQVMLAPRALRRGAEPVPTLYVMQGWVKLSNPAGATPAVAATPRADALRVSGNLIVGILPQAQWVFAETGNALVAPRRDGHATAPLQSLHEGDSFVLRASGAGELSRLPPADLRSQLPRAFLDSLPRRATRLAGATVEPAGVAGVSYSDVALWINGEPALRSSLVGRLSPRAHEPGFRQALVADIKLHPEWQTLLFPPPPRRAAPVAARQKPAALELAAASRSEMPAAQPAIPLAN